MSAVLTSVNRKDDNLVTTLVEYNKFDVSKQCKDCVDLHNTENEFILGSRKLRHDQQPRSDIQTFSNILELDQKFVDEVLTMKGGWFHISCELVDLQAR